MTEREDEVYQRETDSQVPLEQPGGSLRWLSPEYAKTGFLVGVGLAITNDAYVLISLISKYGPLKQEELPLIVTILGLQTAQIIGVSFLVSSFRPFSERIAANLRGYRLLADNAVSSIRGRFHRN